MTITSPGLTRRQVTLFAVASGLSVANVYYAQPLLPAIGETFAVGPRTTAFLVTLTQICYAVGLALLVPLGDTLNRRRLVMTMLLIVAVAQFAAATAPTVAVLLIASSVVACCAVVAPILVAFAASLAEPEHRGQVAGTVLSGVLAGVLLARTAGGLIAQWGGWRATYAVAGVSMALLTAAVWRVLPEAPPPASLGYLALLRSVPRIMVEEPVLRRRCAYGFLCFAGFNVFWTSISYLLAGPSFGYGPAAIGLLGLTGLAGAFAARIAGRLSDAGGDRSATGTFLLVILVSWGALATGAKGLLWPLLLGVVVLDFGVQAMQATNLAVSYRLQPEARSRITMAYMTVYFLGGVVGAAVSGAAYTAGGWPAVCLAGGSFAGLTLAVWLIERIRPQGDAGNQSAGGRSEPAEARIVGS